MNKLGLLLLVFSLAFSQQYQSVNLAYISQETGPSVRITTQMQTNPTNIWHIYNVTADKHQKSSVSIALGPQSNPCVSYTVWARPDLLNMSSWKGNGWVEETIDDSNLDKKSSPTSMAVDAHGGFHIAYRLLGVDNEEDGLAYASYLNGTWTTKIVEKGDSHYNFGDGSSLELDVKDNPRISYSGEGDIRYASWNGTAWNIKQVDSAFSVYAPTSLALDSKEYPHMTYYYEAEKTDRYARWDGSQWNISLLKHHYRDSSIAVDSNDIPHIVSTGPGGLPLPGTYPLIYSKLLGGTWQSEVLFPGYAYGLAAAISLDSHGYPHIAYLSLDNGVNYARWNGRNWTTEKIEGPIVVSYKLALVLDANDVPFVAYKDADTYIVRVATKANLSSNKPPIANSGGDYGGQEGSQLNFDGTYSHDPEGGSLSFSWDFDASFDLDGDGNHTNDVEATGPTPIHAYGDNGAYTVTLKVTDDAGLWDTDTCIAAILNVPPVADADGPYGGDEPHTVQFIGSFADPGFLDNQSFQWDFDYDGITFDVDSTEQNPTREWLDDYDRDIAFKVIDDDGGWGMDITHVTVNNVPPIADAKGPYEGFEGKPVGFEGTHTDPGPLDTHTYEWDLDYDGITFSPDATGSIVRYTWYDDHSGNIAFKVTDDDGGWDIDVSKVLINNVPPTADAGEDKEGFEVSTFTFDGSCYDPGIYDTHTYEWDFDYDGINFDVDATGQSVSHTWIDDFDGDVALRVTDDDGDEGIDTAHVLVKNVPPTVELEVLQIEVDVLLRIAGEKWHDVSIELYEDGSLIAEGSLTRYPGSPKNQMLDLAHLNVDISKEYSAIVRYTPEDDPVNGQNNGANPCWIIFKFNDGEEVWLHHTFNVQHPETYIWQVDLTAAILSHGLTFEAPAYDPGADDLTFHWDFGDGTNTTSFYPNVNGTYPVEIVETITHVFPGSGTYVVVLTVEDDDTGVASALLTIEIP